MKRAFKFVLVLALAVPVLSAPVPGETRPVEALLAKRDTVEPSAIRAEDVAVRIFQAEQMGAGECQPRKLAQAKAELEIARRTISDINSDAGAIEAVLARAESASGSMLAARRYAAFRGIRCTGE